MEKVNTLVSPHLFPLHRIPFHTPIISLHACPIPFSLSPTSLPSHPSPILAAPAAVSCVLPPIFRGQRAAFFWSWKIQNPQLGLQANRQIPPFLAYRCTNWHPPRINVPPLFCDWIVDVTEAGIAPNNRKQHSPFFFAHLHLPANTRAIRFWALWDLNLEKLLTFWRSIAR